MYMYMVGGWPHMMSVCPVFVLYGAQ